jgi:glycerophosphoryl diester phosphodiesterase
MFDLQGHRGARGLFPENTIEGFRATRALGVLAVELDVGVTRDGAVVVHHDPRLNADIARDKAGRWVEAPGPPLRDLTLAELREYDVGRLRPGSPTARRFPRQQARDGARIPLLADVLALVPALRVTIEMKVLADRPDWTVSPEEMAERTLAVVKQAEALDRVTVQSFDWRAPRWLRRTRPELAFAWLTRPETVAKAPLWWDRPVPASVPEAVAAEGGGTWTPEWTSIGVADIAAAHDLGLHVVPWTVNEPADMARLRAWGADGLISDFPDRLVQQGQTGKGHD